MDEAARAICRDLHALGAVQFGTFTLKSGKTSPVYVDLRLLVADPPLLARVARAYVSLMTDLTFDVIAAIPYAGLPIGTAVALETGRPLVYPRKEAKAYGTRRSVEGRFEAGQRAVVLDDLISSGESKIEAIEPLVAAGLVVEDVVVLIDRQGGGAEALEAAGLRLHSVLTLSGIAAYLSDAGLLDEAACDEVLAFVGASKPGA